LSGEDDAELLKAAALPLVEASSGQLTILGVLPNLPTDATNRAVADAARQAMARLENGLRERIDGFIWPPGQEATIRIEVGKLHRLAAEAATATGAEMLVKAVAPPEEGGRLAADDRKLVRLAPCPVLIARPGGPNGHVAVAVDRPEDRKHEEAHKLLNRTLIRRAAELAKAYGKETVKLLHAWQPEKAAALDAVHDMVQPTEITKLVAGWEETQRRWLSDYAEELRGADYTGGIGFEPVLVSGPPASALEDEVRRSAIGTLVIGTSNRRGLAGLIVGNVAERLIDRVGCSLLVLKPEGTTELLQTMAAE
jgi:nucleotide-binding universal stress UspA family protein